MKETLHFCDDPTHKKMYCLIDIVNILLEKNFKIIKAGTRRNFYNIALIPLRLIYYKLKGKNLVGGIFWDLLGFAEFIFAKKMK